MKGISMKSYYNYLIKKSRATLFKLTSLRGENADLKAEKLLKTCSIEVVETVSIILILGRDAYYDKQTEPVKDPVKLFKEYYDEHWIDDPEMKEYEIEYIVSKRDLPDYLQAGMKALNIQ